MELVILTTLVALAITILAFTNYKRKSGRELNLPPGSFGWPIIGETLEFLFGKPEKFVGDRMKKYSPNIFKTKILGEKVVVLCGPAGNKFIFSNEQKLVTSWRPHSTQKLMRSYQSAGAPPPPPTPDNPKEHDTKVLRQAGFFKPEALARFLGKMDSITQEHIKLHWEGNQHIEVFPLSKIFTLTLASYFFLGLTNGHDRITKLAKEFDDVSLGLHCIPINFPGTIFYHAKKGAAFGGGPRLCPGKEYARLAILCFLHNIVKRSKWELMIPDEKITGDMIPTPAQGVPIRLIPHST